MSYPPPFMPPAMMPPLNQPPPNFRPPGQATIGSLPQLYANPTPLPPVMTEPPEPEGPLITVFVGNISERIPDGMLKQILTTCGSVVNWKRVSTFGFCEFDGPIAGARAVRLLNDLEIDEKRLVAKVDAKNKALLDKYEEDTNLNATQATKDANAEEEKRDDHSAGDVIQAIIEAHAEEIRNAPKPLNNLDPIHKSHKTLNSTNVPDEKREIINQEIGRFRKYTEEAEKRREKEKDRKQREEEKRHKSPRESKEKKRRTPVSEDESPKKEKEKKSRRRSPSRDREEERKERERREREEREERERIRERERQMERERREREREEQPKTVKNMRELQKEKEMEEEARERKKQEKKARDKENAYQERLKNWEAREKRKAKDYDKERDKDQAKEEERLKEAKRLKEFLEDYEDERDDPRFYKGRELQRRLAERVREADSDAKDRAREQEELEELKSKIFSGEYDNPTQEFERQKREREELYKPKLFLHNDGHTNRRRPNPVIANEIPIDVEPIDSDDEPQMISHTPPNNHIGDRISARNSESRSEAPQMVHDDDSRASSVHSANTPGSPARSTPSTAPMFQVTLNLNANAKKKKLEVKDVFANDDDQEEMNGPKKRKLVPLDYDDPQPAKASPNEHKSSSRNSSRHQSSSNSAKDEAKRGDDEKRRHIKSIIDKIPTEKNALFSYPLDKSEIDSTIEKKIRPWINKKIIEYIGEPEPTLVDFICSKVLAGSTPQGILDDVQMVLDEEAEVFVVKMWRLLIYEVEAKKLGISK